MGRFTSQVLRIYIPPAAMARRSTGTLNICSSFGLSFYILGNLRACMYRHVCITYIYKYDDMVQNKKVFYFIAHNTSFEKIEQYLYVSNIKAFSYRPTIRLTLPPPWLPLEYLTIASEQHSLVGLPDFSFSRW